MAFDYSGLQSLASSLLAQFGRTAIVRAPVSSSSPAAGTVTKYKPIDTPVNAILVAINEKNAPGALIKQGDKLAFVDGAITTKDLLIQDDEQWQVVSVDEIKPGDTSIIWKAQIRR